MKGAEGFDLSARSAAVTGESEGCRSKAWCRCSMQKQEMRLYLQ